MGNLRFTGARVHQSLASAHEQRAVTIRPVKSKKDRKAFVDFAWEVYKDDPAWIPPLKDEVHGLITPGKNPWFEHARAQLWLAERGGKVVGRISAQVDDLVLEYMGKGIGQWGFFDALDGQAAAALIAKAEEWLRAQGMTSALRPISLSIWDEPGLWIEGFAEPPTAMMGHHRPEYQAWIEAATRPSSSPAPPSRPRLVPDRQADRPKCAGHALRPQPFLGLGDQRRGGLAVKRVEEAPLADALAHIFQHQIVDLRADPADDLAARSASHSWARACSNQGFLPGVIRP